MKNKTYTTATIYLMLCLFSFSCNQQQTDYNSGSDEYKISSLKIYYSQDRKLFCLDLPTISMQEFLSLPNLNEIVVGDSATISIFEKSIVSSIKDTVEFVQDTITIDDINFELGEESSSKLINYEEKKSITYSYGRWDGTDAYIVIKIFTDNGIDTLAISNNSLLKVQFNNTVFSDSLLFHVVSDIICKSDSEWTGEFSKYLHLL